MADPISTTDVAVVGGGPAGLAAAIAARLAGCDVIVVERRHPPIDKPCGEGILPDGAAILERLGVDPNGSGAVALRGIDLVGDRVRARGQFPARSGLGMRRTALHRALARRAEQVGVRLLWGREVRRLGRCGPLLDEGEIRARWTIGADGLNSPIRRALRLDTAPIHRRFGMRCHFDRPPWTDHVEIHFADGCETYVTPVGPSTIGIAALVDDPSLRFDGALSLFPSLVRRLAGAPRLNEPQGAATVYRRSPRVSSGPVALIGDAAGSVDAITGDGITLALQQATVLARCLKADDLAPYEAACARMMRFPGALTRAMLAIARRNRLRATTLRLLTAAPWLLSSILRLHTGDHPLTRRDDDTRRFSQEPTGESRDGDRSIVSGDV